MQPSEEPHVDDVTTENKKSQNANRTALYSMWSSIAFSVCAEIFSHFQDSIAAGISLIVALCFSSYVVQKRNKVDKYMILLISWILFTTQFIITIGAVFNLLFGGPYITTDPVKMILSLAFGLVGFGLALCVAATYLPKWPYTEPLALAIVALTLGALCLPGLGAFTRPLDYPPTNGIGLLFATGPADQEISLRVRLIGLNIPAYFHQTTSEEFDISTSGKRTLNWALLIAGDAQMTQESIDWDSSHNIRFKAFNGETSNGDYTGTLELFSGTVSSKAPTWVDGDVYTDYVNRSSDHSAALLPDFGQGYAVVSCPHGHSDTDDCLMGWTDGATESAIAGALQGQPVSRALKDFPVSVDGGVFWSTDSIVNPQPTPSSKRPNPNEMLWSGTGNLQVSYNTAAKTVNDDTSDVLFVFAILFGVAGAGLLGAIQMTIHVITSPESEKKSPIQPHSDS
jgi:hypothetical protein